MFCLLMAISASLTGYLDKDPVADPEIAEGTHHRFVVLHFFVQPAFIATMLLLWHLAFRAPRKLEAASG